MIIFNWIRLIQYRKKNHAENSFLYRDENGLSPEEKKSLRSRFKHLRKIFTFKFTSRYLS